MTIVSFTFFLQSFGNTFSNLLDADNAPGWESLQDDNPDMGSELLLDNAEDFGLLLASSLEEDQELLISTENIGMNSIPHCTVEIDVTDCLCSV